MYTMVIGKVEVNEHHCLEEKVTLLHIATSLTLLTTDLSVTLQCITPYHAVFLLLFYKINNSQFNVIYFKCTPVQPELFNNDFVLSILRKTMPDKNKKILYTLEKSCKQHNRK